MRKWLVLKLLRIFQQTLIVIKQKKSIKNISKNSGLSSLSWNVTISLVRGIRCVSLDNDQLDAQISSTFITILYMYVFRAISRSSSGGQIVLIQHLVSSLCQWPSGAQVERDWEFSLNLSQPVHRRVTDRVTIPDAILTQFDLMRMSKILLETCTCIRL